MSTLNRVLVFGATSTIAEHTLRLLIKEGASVYCIGRNDDRLTHILEDLRIRAGQGQTIEGLSEDLTNTSTHEIIIKNAVEVLGGIDSVLIAYGSLPDQKHCEKNVAQLKTEIEVNALSILELLTPIANLLEKQKHGVIAVISSVAGDRGRQSNYIYGSAKGMLNIYLQGLRNRLSRSGVRVVTIKPGFVDTRMTIDFDKAGALWAKPEKIAYGIVQAMKYKNKEVYLPWYWHIIMLTIKLIPEKLFKRLSL